VANPATTLVAVGNPSAGPSRLPYSGQELHTIAGLFGRRARVLEGDLATEGQVRDGVAGGARMLHFATRGVIDESRPDRSGLVLTPRPPVEDGLLQMREVYGMRMDADLVTLSACQTALGRNVTGEGVIGLARAFYYAGARSVVASLWDVDDRSTARLMELFYRQLRDGKPIDVALQQAKLSVIRDAGQTAAPFYWASFIASGRASVALDVPPQTWSERVLTPVRVAIAAALLVLTLGAAGWWWTRAKRRGGVTEAVS
jgi:CHAT domain-containing protein